jgi:hypothetical protein
MPEQTQAVMLSPSASYIPRQRANLCPAGRTQIGSWNRELCSTQIHEAEPRMAWRGNCTVPDPQACIRSDEALVVGRLGVDPGHWELYSSQHPASWHHDQPRPSQPHRVRRPVVPRALGRRALVIGIFLLAIEIARRPDDVVASSQHQHPTSRLVMTSIARPRALISNHLDSPLRPCLPAQMAAPRGSRRGRRPRCS